VKPLATGAAILRPKLTDCICLIDELMEDSEPRTVTAIHLATGVAKKKISSVLSWRMKQGVCSVSGKIEGGTKFIPYVNLYKYAENFDPFKVRVSPEEVLAAARRHAVPSVWALGARA
jgi:hypothetical protein